MNSLIIASQLNKNARANYKKYFNELKTLVEVDVGSICYDGDEIMKRESFERCVESY